MMSMPCAALPAPPLRTLRWQPQAVATCPSCAMPTLERRACTLPARKHSTLASSSTHLSPAHLPTCAIRPLQICRARPRCLTCLKLAMFALLAWDAGNTAGGSQRWSSALPAGAADSALSTPGMPSAASAPAPPPATCTVGDAAAFRLWLGGQSSADCPGGQQQDCEPPATAGSVTTGGAEEPAAASCCGGRSLPLVALVAEVGQVCYAAALYHASALWAHPMLPSAPKHRWCLLDLHGCSALAGALPASLLYATNLVSTPGYTFHAPACLLCSPSSSPCCTRAWPSATPAGSRRLRSKASSPWWRWLRPTLTTSAPAPSLPSPPAAGLSTGWPPCSPTATGCHCRPRPPPWVAAPARRARERCCRCLPAWTAAASRCPGCRWVGGWQLWWNRVVEAALLHLQPACCRSACCRPQGLYCSRLVLLCRATPAIFPQLAPLPATPAIFPDSLPLLAAAVPGLGAAHLGGAAQRERRPLPVCGPQPAAPGGG